MVKFQGFELHGVYETASGKKNSETDTRTFDQIAIDAIYRMDNLYFGARYNTVSGELQSGEDVSTDRIQVGAGWFMTSNVLLKAVYTSQTYNDYPRWQHPRRWQV